MTLQTSSPQLLGPATVKSRAITVAAPLSRVNANEYAPPVKNSNVNVQRYTPGSI